MYTQCLSSRMHQEASRTSRCANYCPCRCTLWSNPSWPSISSSKIDDFCFKSGLLFEYYRLHSFSKLYLATKIHVTQGRWQNTNTTKRLRASAISRSGGAIGFSACVLSLSLLPGDRVLFVVKNSYFLLQQCLKNSWYPKKERYPKAKRTKCLPS